jgi:ribosomal protein L7/L12
MKVIKILGSGILLTIGFMFLMVSMVISTDKNPTQKDKSAFLGGLLLGIPATVAGGLLVWNLYQNPRKQSQSQLQAIFFRVLKAGNGRITPLGLAMEAGISGEAAKAYLDERAREFVANFDVDAEGNVYYCFNLGGVSLLEPQPIANTSPAIAAISVDSTPGDSFDVILQSVPSDRKIAAIKVVRELTGLGLKEAKDLVEGVPCTLKQDLNRQDAHRFQQRLESTGAIVALMRKSSQ